MTLLLAWADVTKKEDTKFLLQLSHVNKYCCTKIVRAYSRNNSQKLNEMSNDLTLYKYRLSRSTKRAIYREIALWERVGTIIWELLDTLGDLAFTSSNDSEADMEV